MARLINTNVRHGQEYDHSYQRLLRKCNGRGRIILKLLARIAQLRKELRKLNGTKASKAD